MNSETLTERLVTVTPYRAQDARDMLVADRALEALNGKHDETYEYWEKAGPAWTLRVNDHIVGCAGLIRWPWAHVATAWLLPSQGLEAYPKSIVLAVVETLRECLRTEPIRRIDCLVQADHPKAQRFIEWIGFTREQDGLARSLGPRQEDMLRYELVVAP